MEWFYVIDIKKDLVPERRDEDFNFTTPFHLDDSALQNLYTWEKSERYCKNESRLVNTRD